MFYLRERSFETDDPTLVKLRNDGLFFPRDRKVALDWARTASYEHPLIDWATSIIDPTKFFVDIGAHIGTYSLGLAPHCAGVVSFECFPRTFNYLCANIALRELDHKIVPHRTAMGNRTGSVEYTIRSHLDGASNTCLDLGDNCPKITVPITTLDSFGLTNIGLIKIDVEGFEKDVLEGGLETLRRNKYPKIMFESWRPERESEGIPATRLREELFDYVRSIGYSVIPIRGWDEMFLAEYSTP